MSPPQRRDKVARGVEVGSGAVAGTIGTALGAAKLRDQYKEDYPHRFAPAAAKVTSTGERVAPKVGRLARIASEGKPHFPQLVALAGSAALGTGAKKYRKHREAAGITKFLTPALPPITELEKSLFHRRKGQPLLSTSVTDAMSTVDTKVRQVKNKLVPATPVIVERVANEGVQAVGQAKATVSKYYDPERSRRRRLRAVEAGGLVGGGVLGQRAMNERRDALGQWEGSSAMRAAADEESAKARRSGGDVAQRLSQSARDLPRTDRTMGTTFGRHQDQLRHQANADHLSASAEREAGAARTGLRTARRKGTAALTLVAIGLDARHRKNERRY